MSCCLHGQHIAQDCTGQGSDRAGCWQSLLVEPAPAADLIRRLKSYVLWEGCTTQTRAFSIFRTFWSRTGPRDPSGCVGIAEISLGACSKRDLVEFLLKRYTFRSNLGPQALLIRFWDLWSLKIASGTLPRDSEHVFPSMQGPHTCFLIPNYSQISDSPKTDE